MKKFLKEIQFLGILGAVLISSCGCPEFNTEPNPDPRVREATITEFNPNFETIAPDTVATPVPQYSVHTFQFPNDVSSSGSLPNDNRVTGGKTVVLAQRDTIIEGNRYSVQLVSNVPTNSSLIGDMLISQVLNVTGTPAARSAKIRFFGGSRKYTSSLNSASAGEFANYLRRADVKAETDAFGGGGLSKGTETKLTTNDIQILNADGTVTNFEPKFQQTADELLALPVATVFELEVRIGEVYYYRARNGVEFGVLIEDIRQGSITPNLNRVTIKFAELKGPSCEPE
ncbi:MAG: hypothetical protein V4642_16380 [Bacteroidota bacterium]